MPHDSINVGSIMTYTYSLRDDVSCTFIVKKGLIFIEIIGKGNIFDELVIALNEVTEKLLQNGTIPQINIVKSNHFLQCLARKCGYVMSPSYGIRFNVWTHS